MLQSNISNASTDKVYDVSVVGGGINGVGIAADAAGRNLSVFLCERDDLANHTSSASSKLIHGGLRYLEHYEFRLVREALAEREVLLGKAPHIIKPMRFVLPHRPHLRPAWMIRAGLFLYDHLGTRKKLPGSKGIRFGAGSPLKPEINRGFEYSDCWVDDARLVVINAMAAHERGAQIHTRTKCLGAIRENELWQLHLERHDGSRFSIRSRALVNAGGPWVAKFIGEGLKERSPYKIRLIQGSHIVVPRMYEGENAFIMQNQDRRIVFAIPYLGRYTMIGTTDREFEGDPASVQISEDEIHYLLSVANTHFRKQLTRDDVLHTFSGVRPLCDDESNNPSAITRDYTLSLSADGGQAPLLSVFGGKLTTYRKLAEAALVKLMPYFTHMGPNWTMNSPLPGGENMTTPQALSLTLQEKIKHLPASQADRWASTYGSRAWQMLDGAMDLNALGECFGADLFSREIDYLRAREWAVTAEDVLWRRTKLGYSFSKKEVAALEAYLKRLAPAKTDHAIA